uniref:Uncharacterized protein n=1 Tax=Octopus bimaculoides TaxID=37653 RepID=A0A0L8I076_OCTBM
MAAKHISVTLCACVRAVSLHRKMCEMYLGRKCANEKVVKIEDFYCIECVGITCLRNYQGMSM